MVPIIIGAVMASGTALDRGPWSDMFRWIQLIAVFDILALVFSALAFENVLQE